MFFKDLFYRFKQNWLKLLSAALTIIWIFVLLFPLYWLLVSSTKDASEAMRNPPRLGIVLPKDYTIYLDTTDAEDYDEEDFQYEALVLQWMLSARNFSINLNSVTVARVESDKVISTATLNYATYREVEEDIFVGSVAETLIMNWRVNGSKKYQTMLSIMEEDGYETGLNRTPKLSQESENIEKIITYFANIMDPDNQTITQSERISSVQGEIIGVSYKSNFVGMFNNYVAAYQNKTGKFTFIKYMGNKIGRAHV